MRDSDQDRKAHQDHLKAEKREQAILRWLALNPEIGRLNGDKFYKVVSGEMVQVSWEPQCDSCKADSPHHLRMHKLQGPLSI